MRNKSALCGICIFIMWFLFLNSTALASDESEHITKDVPFHNETDGRSIDSQFLYSDEMMLSDANILSTDIAKVAIGLATAAYTENEILRCYEEMEYSLIEKQNYDKNKRPATESVNSFV